MPASKIVLEEVFEEPFLLFAIHCSLEEYRLAYILNKQLGLRLERSRKDVDLQEKGVKSLFPLYISEDEQEYYEIYLVSNVSRTRITSEKAEFNLFAGEDGYKKSFLLPEFQKVDYFLKIQGDLPKKLEASLLPVMKEIQQISTAYAIDYERIKSKENLIFE